MNASLAFLRPVARWLAPVLGLLLLCNALASGLHQHHGAPHGPCAVCSASLSPAVQSPASAPSTAPELRGERLAVALTQVLRPIAAPIHSSRAPPTA